MSRHPALPTFAFPVAHLPALLAIPELTGARVYAGWRGLGALAAIALVGAAWLLVSLGSSSRERVGARRRRWPHPFGVGALLLALGTYGAFAMGAFSTPRVDPWGASMALVVGLVAVWYVVGRLYVGQLGEVIFDKEARARFLGALYRLERKKRARTPGELP